MTSEKKGTFVPDSVTSVPNGQDQLATDVEYAAMVAIALRQHLGTAHHATKTVMKWTGASESAVKSWFAGTKAPGGRNLIVLARYSDPVFESFLRLSGREQILIGQSLAETQGKVRLILRLLEDLAPLGAKSDL
jgi:hypothetical protein